MVMESGIDNAQCGSLSLVWTIVIIPVEHSTEYIAFRLRHIWANNVTRIQGWESGDIDILMCTVVELPSSDEGQFLMQIARIAKT